MAIDTAVIKNPFIKNRFSLSKKTLPFKIFYKYMKNYIKKERRIEVNPKVRHFGGPYQIDVLKFCFIKN